MRNSKARNSAMYDVFYTHVYIKQIIIVLFLVFSYTSLLPHCDCEVFNHQIFVNVSHHVL